MKKKNIKYYSLFILVLFVSVVCLINYITVKAEVITYNEDINQYPYCLNIDIANDDDFPVSSVTVNGNNWYDDENSYEFRNDSKNYTIIVKAGMKGNEYPELSLAGGFEDNGGTRSAVINTEQDPNVEGDEYIFTLNLGEGLYNGVHTGEVNQQHCSGFGFSIVSGPPIEVPTEDVTGNISITISGDELEYHYDANDLDKADVAYFKFSINGGTEEERLVPFRFGNANYTYNNNPAPNNVSSVTTINPIEYAYPYNGSGEVEFCVNGGGTDEYTSLIINDHDYTNEVPHTKSEHWAAMDGWAQMFCFNIPYSTDYDVRVEGEKVPDDYIIPGFGWNYLSSERSNDITPETEGNFAHGRLRFVSASVTIENEELEFNSVNAFNNYRYHGTGQIFQWNDGRKDYPEEQRFLSWGECQLPVGTTLTVEIIPDRGYQLTRLAVSQNGFQATDIPGQYTITLNEQNFNYDANKNLFDLNPTFEEVDATATTNSENLVGVHIDVAGGDNAFITGTPKLQVSDVNSMSPDRESDFVETAEAEGYTIENYLELDLYNAIYKGGKTDGNNNYLSWDTPVHELANNAIVNLELNDQLSGSQVAVVHEVRNENNEITGYDLIEGNYNADTKVISFETDGFSTYAIAYKGDAPVTSTHNVVFNTRGGSNIDSEEVNHGDPVGRPNDPENGNYVFGGWYTEEGCQNEYDFNTPVESDLELFAKWLETYRIDFDTRCEQGLDPVYVVEGEKLEEPEDPQNGNMILVGWFLDDEFNNEYDFNEPVDHEFTLIAKWTNAPEDYTVGDDDLSISFTDESGHDFRLEVIDYYVLTSEQLEEFGISQEEYDAVFNMILDATKSKGELLSFLDILVYDEYDHEIHEPLMGKFNIKIKLTPEMKKFNSFKLIYMNDDMSLGEEIELSIVGDYLVGTLDHLSNYSLIGNTVSNPKTGDNIMNFVLMLLVSILGIGGIIYLKKNKLN